MNKLWLKVDASFRAIGLSDVLAKVFNKKKRSLVICGVPNFDVNRIIRIIHLKHSSYLNLRHSRGPLSFQIVFQNFSILHADNYRWNSKTKPSAIITHNHVVNALVWLVINDDSHLAPRPSDVPGLRNESTFTSINHNHCVVNIFIGNFKVKLGELTFLLAPELV